MTAGPPVVTAAQDKSEMVQEWLNADRFYDEFTVIMPAAGEHCFRTILMRRNGRVEILGASREAQFSETPDDCKLAYCA